VYDIQKFRDALDLIDKYFFIPAVMNKIIYLLPHKIWGFVVSQLKFWVEKVNNQMRLLIVKQCAFTYLPWPKKKKGGLWQSVLQVSFKHSR